jgi:hypothetical protein
VPFDEKWSFVGKKQKHRSADDPTAGDGWDHTALDPESRPVVSLVVGKRTAPTVGALVRDFRDRTGGRVMRRMTSDAYAADPEAIRAAYGQPIEPPRTGCPGRPRRPRAARVELPPELTYATIHQERENNRVARISTPLVFGTALALVLILSTVSRSVNPCFVGRHNGTDRNRCSRKVRPTYGFSRDWESHRAASRFRHFRWPVRTLRVRDETGR